MRSGLAATRFAADRAAACALLLALAPPAAFAQREGRVVRSDVKTVIRLSGTVIAEDFFRLKSTIEGRVEGIRATTNTWSSPRERVGFLATKQLAAIMDANATMSQDLLEERWRALFEAAPIRCPTECFLVRIYARNKKWVRPNAVLLEAAKVLRLSGRVKPLDVQWVKDGMTFEYWPAGNPDDRHTATVEGFVLDIQGQKIEPGGSFTSRLSPRDYLPLDTPWEGMIVVRHKTGVRSVPTAALIRHGQSIYLPVLVSTGVTTGDLTEISGVEEGTRFLSLTETERKGTEAHRLQWRAPPPPPAGQVLTPRKGAAAEPPAGESATEERPAPEEAAPSPEAPPEPPRAKGKEIRTRRRASGDLDPYAQDKPYSEDD